MWDHRNDDCQNRGFVDADLRRTIPRMKTKKLEMWGKARKTRLNQRCQGMPLLKHRILLRLRLQGLQGEREGSGR